MPKSTKKTRRIRAWVGALRLSIVIVASIGAPIAIGVIAWWIIHK
jgi:hypothetical protein